MEHVHVNNCINVSTAGLPHVIVRFFTVPTVRDARVSAGWALVFIALCIQLSLLLLLSQELT